MQMKSQKNLVLSASGSWLGFRQLDNERGRKPHILDFPPALRYWSTKSPTVILWTFFMKMLVCLPRQLRDHPKCVFRQLHRNHVEKDSGVLLHRTRILWNVATPSVQSKDFVISRANRRDYVPLGSQYTSAGSTVFICGWSKGICCPWIGVFVVKSPARYTKHSKYLSRCLLEALPPMSVGNLVPYLMKSRQFIYCLWEILYLPEMWILSCCIP